MDEFNLSLNTYKMYFEFLMNMLELLQERHINKANDKDKRLGNSVGYRQVVVPFTVDNKLMELALQNTGVSMIKGYNFPWTKCQKYTRNI